MTYKDVHGDEPCEVRGRIADLHFSGHFLSAQRFRTPGTPGDAHSRRQLKPVVVSRYEEPCGC